MINRSNSSDRRRILTFPVVHPCQSISPTTLLSSLISLSNQICNFQSKSFVTQKKNARETIRYVGNLLIFFEEVRDKNFVLPNSINLCFFELHLTFQKLLCLLEDCTREGCRSWILMKFKRVSTEFRVLVRTVATALDVLPLSSIEVSTEIREVLELVAKQAEKARFEVEPEDERIAVTVMSILNQFENRIVPDPIELKRVLDYLEIRNWNQCYKEIKFLEEEIIIGRSNGEEKEIDFLRNLMAFMIYSRVVVFDFVDENNRTGTEIPQFDDQSNHGEVIRCLNPEDFLCPISLEIMTDPVIISTGHTFDRISIKKWFKSGNQICPKTGEKLASTELVPNLVLRKLISQYCSINEIPMVQEPSQSRNRDDSLRTTRKEPTSQSGAAEEAMKMVATFLACNLATGTGFDKNKSAYEIRLLAKSGIFNMSCLAESGTIPYLLNLLCSMSPSTQENAMAALLNLSKYQKQSKIKRLIVENGGLVLILDVLTEGLKIETRKSAATTLFHLSSIEEHRKLIGEIPEAIPALVKLLRESSLNSSGKKSVVVAILGLLWFAGNYNRVLAAGTVKVLVDFLNSNSENTEFISESLAVLAILAEKPEGTYAILRTSAALHRLVGLLESPTISPPAKEYCVSILLSLCTNGGSEVVAILRKPTSLMTSLYSLLTDGTSRAGKKASSVLKILHEYSDPSSSSKRPVLRHDRYVHVQ